MTKKKTETTLWIERLVDLSDEQPRRTMQIALAALDQIISARVLDGDDCTAASAAFDALSTTLGNAAPELLAVVQAFADLDNCNDQRDFLAAFDVKYGIKPGEGRRNYLYAAARAAIAKAKGE